MKRPYRAHCSIYTLILAMRGEHRDGPVLMPYARAPVSPDKEGEAQQEGGKNEG